MSTAETRQVSRDSLMLSAEVAVEGAAQTARVRVRNLSAGGMMAEGDVAAKRGHKITVNLRNIGKVEGTVAWVQDNRFGIAFVDSIDPKLARAPVASGTRDPASPRFTRTPVAEPRAVGSVRKL